MELPFVFPCKRITCNDVTIAYYAVCLVYADINSALICIRSLKVLILSPKPWSSLVYKNKYHYGSWFYHECLINFKSRLWTWANHNIHIKSLNLLLINALTSAAIADRQEENNCNEKIFCICIFIHQLKFILFITACWSQIFKSHLIVLSDSNI